MTTRTSRIALAVLVTALGAPIVSFAGSASAMDSCLQAFLDSDLAKDRKVTVYKKDHFSNHLTTPTGLYRIEVVAKGRSSGKELARIQCEADATGKIVSLRGLPTPAASLAQSR